MIAPRPLLAIQEPRPVRVKASFPEKLRVLWEPWRYKILYGGRGSAKSWGAARSLLLKGTQQSLRIVCCREIQESIKQSVYQLLIDQIKLLELQDCYKVLEKEIVSTLPDNDTQFTFHGLRHNVDNIKSLEGCDICWVEEGQNVSDGSLSKLTPTVRKPGSEIWVTFNPELETDAVYERFIVNHPSNAAVVAMNWRDNPWFPDVLNDDREECLKTRPKDVYLHIWEGHCVRHLEGAIYAEELRAADSEGRICKLEYDRRIGVSVYADLGFADMTSLWFQQKVGMEHHMLHTYQNQHKLWHHYMKYIKDTEYVIDTVFLPHDGDKGSVQGISIAQQSRDAGFQVRVLENFSGAVQVGIDAARLVFPSVWFDHDGTSDGVQALRRYHFQKDIHGNYSKNPLHDDNSHYADAFRYFAMAGAPHRTRKADPVQLKKKLASGPVLDLNFKDAGLGWMGQ